MVDSRCIYSAILVIISSFLSQSISILLIWRAICRVLFLLEELWVLLHRWLHGWLHGWLHWLHRRLLKVLPWVILVVIIVSVLIASWRGHLKLLSIKKYFDVTLLIWVVGLFYTDVLTAEDRISPIILTTHLIHYVVYWVSLGILLWLIILGSILTPFSCFSLNLLSSDLWRGSIPC